MTEQGELPKWMVASKSRTDLKVDKIPTNTEDEWLEIEFYDVPFGVNIWKDVDAEMAHLEREIERKKKDKSASLGANAVQVEQMYLKALLKKMVVSINGVKIPEVFFDAQISQAGGLMLVKWIKHKIEGEPFPDPAWLAKRKEQEATANPTIPSSPGPE